MGTTTGTRSRLGRLGVITGAGMLALAALSVVTLPASAAGVKHETRGSCTRSSDWELELEREHGRIEVKVDVDTHRVGRAWRIRIWHDGVETTNVVRDTDRQGDIAVDRTRGDHRGTDWFRFRAVDLVNGEVCRGSLTI
jgi:hypothetical protein